MNKKDAWITIVCFFGFLYGFAVLFWLLPKGEYSEQERRVLAEAPEVTLSSIREGTFMSELETYLADHFPARETLVSLYGGMSYLEGKRDIGDAYVCDDGFLVTRLTEEDLDAVQLRRNKDALAELGNYLAKAELGYQVMVVPSASLQLAEKLPYGAPIYAQDAVLNELADALGSVFVDLRAVLTEPLHYYKTDHHWTTEAAYDAYLVYCEATGLTPVRARRYTKVTVADDFCGTLYSKVLLPGSVYDTITAYQREESLTVMAGKQELPGLYVPEKLESEDKYAYFLGGNYGVLTVRSEVSEGEERAGRKLLLIKDSYANCFVPFLTGNFEEIHVIDLRYYNGSTANYIAEHGITDVLVLYGADGYVLDANVPKLVIGLDSTELPEESGEAKELLSALLTVAQSEQWERTAFGETMYTDSFESLYGVSMAQAQVCDGAIAFGIGNASEISILRVESEDAADFAEEMLRQRLERRRRDFEWYMPQELPKLEEARILRSGTYVILTVSMDVGAIEDEFLKGQK